MMFTFLCTYCWASKQHIYKNAIRLLCLLCCLAQWRLHTIFCLFVFYPYTILSCSKIDGPSQCCGAPPVLVAYSWVAPSTMYLVCARCSSWHAGWLWATAWQIIAGPWPAKEDAEHFIVEYLICDDPDPDAWNEFSVIDWSYLFSRKNSPKPKPSWKDNPEIKRTCSHKRKTKFDFLSFGRPQVSTL